jgi:uncharacterized protein YkwD
MIINSRLKKISWVSIASVLILVLSACQFSRTISAMMSLSTVTTLTATVVVVPTMTPTATATAIAMPTITDTYTSTPTPTMTATLTTTPTRTPAPTHRPAATKTGEVSSTASCNGGNASFEAQVRSLINDDRANAGAPALSNNGSLASAARAHSKDMAINNYMSHTGSDGSGPDQRIQAAGYSFSAYGETIFGGNGPYNSPYSAVSGWMGSTDHREIMLSSTYTDVGIGYWCDPNNPFGYFTADFGRR